MCVFFNETDNEEIALADQTAPVEAQSRPEPQVQLENHGRRDLTNWKRFRACSLWFFTFLILLIIVLSVILVKVLFELHIQKRAVDRAVVMLAHARSLLKKCGRN